MATVRPGTERASVCATWSNVLWSSLRTITRHSPPSPLPGPSTRGSSTVWLTGLRLAVPAPQDGENDGHGCRDRAKDLGVLQARDEHRADDLADGQRALLGGRRGGLRARRCRRRRGRRRADGPRRRRRGRGGGLGPAARLGAGGGRGGGGGRRLRAGRLRLGRGRLRLGLGGSRTAGEHGLEVLRE